VCNAERNISNTGIYGILSENIHHIKILGSYRYKHYESVGSPTEISCFYLTAYFLRKLEYGPFLYFGSCHLEENIWA